MLIDGSGRVGRGVAYSTTEAVHLLNVRAEGMSALADEPDHFAKRFAAEGGEPRGFAQRRLFGRYLGEILAEAIDGGCVDVATGSAVKAEQTGDGWRVELKDGSSIAADALALATGNQEPDMLRAFESAGDRFIANPWGASARAAVADIAATDGDALLVGTGLTMVDLALSLDAAGHRGEIVALSRRGLAPRAHADFGSAPVEASQIPRGSLGAMWRWLRKRSAEVGWRAAVDSVRPYSHSLWQSLDLDGQRRFLRHARPWWDVHRHRIAPDVAATVTRMVAEDRLQIMAGKIVSADAAQDGIVVELRRRGAVETERKAFAYVFNCTGPLHSIQRTRDPLLRSLFDGEQVRPDALGIGLDVDGRSRAGKRLWALGPLTKGRYWEIVAVPDIRDQAAEVADDIARELIA